MPIRETYWFCWRAYGVAAHGDGRGKQVAIHLFLKLPGKKLQCRWKCLFSSGGRPAKTECGLLEGDPGGSFDPPELSFQVHPTRVRPGATFWKLRSSFWITDLGPIGSNGHFGWDFGASVPLWNLKEDMTIISFQVSRSALWPPLMMWSSMELCPLKWLSFNTIIQLVWPPWPSIYCFDFKIFGSGVANVDFVIFPPRWMVGEDTSQLLLPPQYLVTRLFMAFTTPRRKGFFLWRESSIVWRPRPDAETFKKANSRFKARKKEKHIGIYVWIEKPMDFKKKRKHLLGKRTIWIAERLTKGFKGG